MIFPRLHNVDDVARSEPYRVLTLGYPTVLAEIVVPPKEIEAAENPRQRLTGT